MNRFGDNLICTGSNETIVHAFSRFDVEFLVVGGLAVAWYCPSREADDMDLLVNPTAANALKVYRALTSIGLSGFTPDSFARRGVQAQLKQAHYADVITPAQGSLSFDELEEGASAGKLFGWAARIPSIGKLIELKESTAAISEDGSLKHHRDIELLKNALTA